MTNNRDLEPLFRGVTITKKGIDEESRTVELTFSSELPYERWFGMEILDHSEKSVDLSRLRMGAPLLLDHDPSKQIGVIEDVSIGSDRRGRARVRFGKSQQANEIFQDVVDEIRTSVSVGYQPIEMILEEERSNGPDVYRVNKWLPFEVSIVSIPADTSVGTNRSADEFKSKFKSEEVKMTTENKVQETPKAAPAVDVDAIRNQERQDVQKQIRELLAAGEKFGEQALANQCINEGKSLDSFRQLVLEKRSNDAPVKAESPEVGLSEKETRSYSMTKLINALANPNDANAQRAAAFEFEVSAAASAKMKKDTRGAMVPYDVLKRDLNVGTAADGGNLVETSLLSGSFIESLENALALRQCGATMLTGLNGNIAIPRQNGGASHFWLAENGEPTESSATFDQIGMTPKTVGAFTEISRKLLLQSSISMEAFVQNELALRIALAIDAAGIFGTGSNNQPRGLLSYPGVGSVVGGTNGGAIDWGKVVDLETATGTANALVQNMCYLTNAKVRGAAKQTLKAAGVAGYIWEDGAMNGFPVVTSNQVPGNLTKGTGTNLSALAFGNFADLIIGMWGGLDLQVNPYSLDTKGAVRVTAFQDVDIELRHPESFAVMKDIIA
jgi:HK97 family phage major capsid protein